MTLSANVPHLAEDPPMVPVARSPPCSLAYSGIS